MVELGFDKMLLWPIAQHWAVKVGETWYEIGAKEERQRTDNPNLIVPSLGFISKSGVGAFGCQLVGETEKTDKEITEWIEDWRTENPLYGLATKNCQCFAMEFMYWLTGGNHIFVQRPDSVITTPHTCSSLHESFFSPRKVFLSENRN